MLEPILPKGSVTGMDNRDRTSRTQSYLNTLFRWSAVRYCFCFIFFYSFHLFCFVRTLFLQNRSRRQRDLSDSPYVSLTKMVIHHLQFSSPQQAFARKNDKYIIRSVGNDVIKWVPPMTGQCTQRGSVIRSREPLHGCLVYTFIKFTPKRPAYCDM